MTVMVRLFLIRQTQPVNDLAVDTLMPSSNTRHDS
jgi:hypothetical protein